MNQKGLFDEQRTREKAKKNKEIIESQEQLLYDRQERLLKQSNGVLTDKIRENYYKATSIILSSAFHFDVELTKEIKLLESKAINAETFFGWVGGKNKMAPEIITRAPFHEIYIELFMGSAVTFFKKLKVPVNILNDINGNLTRLFLCCRDDVDRLIRKTYWFHKNRLLFDIFKESFKEENFDLLDDRDPYTIAAMYLFMIRNSFNNEESGIFRAFKDGHTDWSDDIFTMLKYLSNKLRDVLVENLSFDKLLDKYIFTRKDNKEIFIFADPPYWVANQTTYYKHIFAEEQHILLAEKLHQVPENVKVIISYDDVPEIRKLYEDWNFLETEEYTYSMSSGVSKPIKKREILISNYKLGNKQGNLL